MLDNLFFIILPYAAVTLAVVVTVQRYLKRGFTYSSLSSQFLEGDELFYGSVPWHIGILVVLTGHVIGFAIPRQVLWFNGVPARLYVLETTGLLFGLLALVGIVSLIVRRITSPRIRAVTSPMDVLVLVVLLVQVALGVYTALFYRWGSSWYVTSAVPYLRSLFMLQPDLRMIAPLPLAVKLHIINAYVFLAIFPFSRLVHMLVVPVHYLWRPYQVVIWNWDRRRHNRPAPKPAKKPVPATKPVGAETLPVAKPAPAR
ncbi:MAG TPA: respiratory nitrate reductase subunit gamma [Pyrinomonadaceae bacterium]|nr:respiratory nitrate reductase subunit gamma [Pyrinomonadaceae bacterium]